VLSPLLPRGWAQLAVTLGALKRNRVISTSKELLIILLIHFMGCPLRETGVRARLVSLGTLKASSLFHRLIKSERWLEALVQRMLSKSDDITRNTSHPIVLIDATTIKKPGSRGTDWRFHTAWNLQERRLVDCQLSDAKGAESFQRFSLTPGTIVIGDRYYSTPPEIGYAESQGWKVVIRVTPHNLSVYDEAGNRQNWHQLIRAMTSRQIRELPVWIWDGRRQQWIEGRVVIMKLTRQDRLAAQHHLRKRAKKMRRPVSADTLKWAGYHMVFTTLDESWSASQILDLYPYRWQIELVFKRLKSILAMGCVPKKRADSARAWLYGKMLVALLIEKLIETANKTLPEKLAESPWRSVWYETKYVYRELQNAIIPHESLVGLIQNWAEIVQGLMESKRYREYQIAPCLS
jgi:hypothetical protein